MRPLHTLMKRKPPTKTLHGFYKWAKQVGHYHAYEAVQRFWRVPS